MFVASSLDSIDQLVRVLGWPTFLGIVAWAVRKWDKGQATLKDIHAQGKLAAENSEAALTEIGVLKTNHFPHLQEGIESVAASNTEAVKVLQSMDKNIAVLVDRTPRV